MNVYLEGVISSDKEFGLTLESFIVYNLLIQSKSEIDVNVLIGNHPEAIVYVKNIYNKLRILDGNVPEIADYCRWPVIVIENKAVAGLCAVLRQIIKISKEEDLKKLLGFKDSCLMACSETSRWTKFCEIEMIDFTKDFLINFNKYIKEDLFNLSDCLTKFEYHMCEPIRMHNIYKIAREIHNDKALKSSLLVEELNLNHVYAEGLYMTLADFVIFCCMRVILSKILFEEVCNKQLPLTLSWIERIENVSNFKLDIKDSNEMVNIKKINFGDIKYESLYSSDPNRHKQRVNISISAIEELNNSLKGVKIVNDFLPYGREIEISWNSIPFEANPINGALPQKRSQRKREQLENLAKAVIKITGNNTYKIVDFCSGGGHLGILIATLLPNSKIILVENKERSLKLASERIAKLKLNNIEIVQSNLDYFTGKFDVGVSLHACGVATDLVIRKSIENRAHFVCCPCCYGGIKDCHQVVYPRSDCYKTKLGYENYLNAAHAADQTHDSENPKTENGFRCMDIIDTDRKLYAEGFGYKVHLGKLQPVSCTPKNNLLIGILC